ncbi:MAG: hypothetical protein R3C28_24375 [Pirellulaceae bacterium]
MAQVRGFVETFDGDGTCVVNVDDTFGFDDCGWRMSGYNGHWELDGSGQLRVHVDGDDELERLDGGETRFFKNVFFGSGSFRSRVELVDVDLFVPEGRLPYDVDAMFGFGISRFSTRIIVFPDTEGQAIVGTTINSVFLGRRLFEFTSNIAIEWLYDQKLSEVTLRYESDGNELVIGPDYYEVTMDDVTEITLDAQDLGAVFVNDEFVPAYANLGIDWFGVMPILDIEGDFTSDEIVNAADIDRLSNAIATNYQNVGFDLNDDAEITEADRTILIQNILNTYFGDSNLDGEFNSADLVNIFAAGEYEDDIDGNSTWATGDWSGNGEFDSADLVLAFQDGGYELGPREAVRTCLNQTVLSCRACVCLRSVGWCDAVVLSRPSRKNSARERSSC